MKNNRISPEGVAQLLNYDPETGLMRWRFRPWMTGNSAHWNAQFAGEIAGTVHKSGYIQVALQVDGAKYFFAGQRLAWVLHYGEWPEVCVDHIDHDPLNNRIANLRLATRVENSQYKRELRGKVGYKGVYWMPAKGRYAAQIKANKQWKWLGLHLTPEDAARAYDHAARELHGNFAKTNFDMGLLR